MNPPDRRRTVPINVGGVVIGGAAPISVQTMTKTQTEDASATLAQIERAAAAGADIVRVTCDTPEAGRALREIVRGSPVPIVADIHDDAPRALEALEAGVACLRLNPGNITDRAKVADIAREARDRNVPMRIGVNAGSIPNRKGLERGRGGSIEETAQLMVEAALGDIRILEELDFHQIIFQQINNESIQKHEALSKSQELSAAVVDNNNNSKKYDRLSSDFEQLKQTLQSSRAEVDSLKATQSQLETENNTLSAKLKAADLDRR